ncbi:hypothetical protein IF2G_08832 [Cordyceps javanica]|nr:hypothetical protein IF2G_08832 [Cordyceps javanica]
MKRAVSNSAAQGFFKDQSDWAVERAREVIGGEMQWQRWCPWGMRLGWLFTYYKCQENEGAGVCGWPCRVRWTRAMPYGLRVGALSCQVVSVMHPRCQCIAHGTLFSIMPRIGLDHGFEATIGTGSCHRWRLRLS